MWQGEKHTFKKEKTLWQSGCGQLDTKGSVPGTGIEPAHPCERQILSLLRLPIPPPGRSRIENEMGCNITAFLAQEFKKIP
jgi:hypothetical protein